MGYVSLNVVPVSSVQKQGWQLVIGPLVWISQPFFRQDHGQQPSFPERTHLILQIMSIQFPGSHYQVDYILCFLAS